MNTERLKNILRSNGGQWLLLLSFCFIIYFVNLGSEGLYSAQEARAAVITRNMLHDGNWLNMELPFESTTEKPIFCYWLYALCATLVGGANELAVRLPSAISSLATIAMTVWLAGKIYGRATGFLAGYVLATMATFLNLGRTARIDIVLTAFHMGAMVCLYKAYFEQMKKSRWWLYLFYAVLGVSILVKGPVGVVIAAFMLATYMVVFRRWRMMLDLEPYTGAVIMIAIALPWYWYANSTSNGEFFKEFILEQNIKRFFGQSEYKEGKFMPLYWYLPKFFAGALPWTVFVPFALWPFCRRIKNLSQGTWFLVFWFVTGFVFFSCSAVKRGDYILPLYPAAAIMLGRYLIWLNEQKLRLSSRWVYGWGLLVALAAGALVLVRTGLLAQIGARAAADQVKHLSTRDGQSMVQISEMINNRLLLVIVAVAVVLAFLFAIGKVLAKGRVLAAIAWFLPGMMIGMIVFFTVVQPVLDRFNTVKYFCLECDRLMPKDAKVLYLWNINNEVIYYLQRTYDFATDKAVDKAVEQAEYIIIQRKHYNAGVKAKTEALGFRLAAATIPGHSFSNVMLAREKKPATAAAPAGK